MVEVVVVVEVDGRDIMDLGMEDMDGNIILRILWIFQIRSLPTMLPRLVFGLRWPRLPRRECVAISLRWM